MALPDVRTSSVGPCKDIPSKECEDALALRLVACEASTGTVTLAFEEVTKAEVPLVGDIGIGMILGVAILLAGLGAGIGIGTLTASKRD